jgi:hypothetical protein
MVPSVRSTIGVDSAKNEVLMACHGEYEPIVYSLLFFITSRRAIDEALKEIRYLIEECTKLFEGHYDPVL